MSLAELQHQRDLANNGLNSTLMKKISQEQEGIYGIYFMN
jgi:hypothetical protein